MTKKEDLEDKKYPNLWLGIYFCKINDLGQLIHKQ